MRALCFSLALLFALPAAGLAQITVTPDPPPAGGMRMRDFWNGTLVQAGGAAVSLRVRVVVRSAAGEVVFDAQSAAREFAPGTHRLSSLGLEPLAVTRVAPSIEAPLMRTGALPDGRWTLCLEALDPAGAALAAPSCVDVEVASVMPPMPMEPPNGGATSDPFIVWTWFMQPATAAGEAVACDLVVVEILGGQTPEEAMRTNPPVLRRDRLRSSAWQTSDAARALRADQTYAWKLIAKVGDRVASESEIWTFTYLAPETVPIAGGEGAGVAAAGPGAAAAGDTGTVPAMPAAGDSTAAAAATAAAPATPKPVELHAVARATMFSSNRPGTLSKGPSDYARLEIDPTLSIYGSPLALSLLLSTERDPRQSEIQRGSLGFDQARGIGLHQRIEGRTRQLQRSREEMLADTLRLVRDDLERLDQELARLETLGARGPSPTVRELEQLGLVSSAEAAALRIPAFAFGSVAPEHGGLLLSGVTIHGGMVELQPGRWHAGVAGGKLAREDEVSLALPASPDGTRPELFQDLWSARAGLGRKNANHLWLTGLYARDDRQSRAIVALARPGAPAPARENVVLGLAGTARGRSGAWLVDGDVQGSLFTDDRNGPALRDLPESGFLRSLFGSRVREGSAVDWSGNLRGSADLAGGRTRLVSGIRFVGPGYRSAGVRNLRRDVLQVDGSWDQRLAKGFTLGTQWGQDRTGTVLPSSGFANLRRVSTKLAGSLPALAAFDLLYGFHGQNQRPGGALVEIRSRSHLGSLRLRRSATLGRARSLTMLAGDLVVASSNDTTGSHRSTSLQLSEMLSLSSRLGLLARASRTHTRTAIADGPDAEVWAWEGSATWPASALVSLSGGVTGSRSRTLAQAGGFAGATFSLGALGALEVGGSFVNARSRDASVRGFLDRAVRVRLLSGGR